MPSGGDKKWWYLYSNREPSLVTEVGQQALVRASNESPPSLSKAGLISCIEKEGVDFLVVH